jgi:hypothetical protein
MHVHVHVRDFLEGRGTNGVPQAHAFVREGAVNRPGHCDHRIHQCGPTLRIKLPYVADVGAGHDQDMSGIVLSGIDKNDCQGILVNHICRRATRHDLAENAFAGHDRRF